MALTLRMPSAQFFRERGYAGNGDLAADEEWRDALASIARQQ